MEELRSRPWRPPDHTEENSTLVALVTALADSPLTILQTLVDKVLEVLRADSAGLSLLTKDEKRFYWAAIAGAWRPHIGGGTPRDFGPCGDVLDHNVTMLFTHWERRYPYLSMAVPLAEEGLLVPFYVNGKAVGTIWAIAHNNRRQFDAEDLRLLESMGRFASAAYQTVESIENLKLQIAAREEAEIALRELANGLEAKVQRDLTQYMQASEALRAAQAELAHANRVATMGQLTASIAHEVNQPIAATLTNAQAALRCLTRPAPELGEVREALASIVKDAVRAGDVVSRIRDLMNKAPPRKDLLDVNGVVCEVIELTHGEAVKNGVFLLTELADSMPLIPGDRIQLQQVMLNLIINAVEAMSGVGNGARELLISTGKTASGDVLVAVRDSGPGLALAALERVFDPFYTSKPGGLGMGLSICRSIIEAHGGRLWASANVTRGATFQFTVPA